MQLIHPATLPDPRRRAEALETGNILFFPEIPFPLSQEDRDSLLGFVQKSSDLHKNIAFRPAQQKVSGLGKTDASTLDKVRASLSRFSEAATSYAGQFIPNYATGWRLDYASFRGIEEEGRDLPWKKRNDLLHTDAFPTRPTNGGLILRFFVNINPNRERVWMTSDPFEAVARQYAVEAGLLRISRQSPAGDPWKRLARGLGFPLPDRSPYDAFMLGFHDYLKSNAAYQRDSPKYQFHFPPNSAWMVFTDVVPHAVLSGQYALEQTFIVAPGSLALPESAPASILERLSGQRMTR